MHCMSCRLSTAYALGAQKPAAVVYEPMCLEANAICITYICAERQSAA